MIFLLGAVAHGAAQSAWPSPLVVSPLKGDGVVGGLAPGFRVVIGHASEVVTAAVSRLERHAPRVEGGGVEVLEIYTGKNEELSEKTDYSYNLTVARRSVASATSIYGIVYALDTMRQLVPGEATRVRDRPLKRHRGLLVDVARHFLPIPLLRRTIVALSLHKMNVLHLHLTDSQSFPAKLRRSPELARKGAFSPEQIYEVSELEGLVEFARFFGVRIVPEIDVPAHTKSWGRAYPRLVVNCSTASIRAATPSDIPALDPTIPETYEVVERVLTEVSQIFPDALLHLGCDEMRFKCWSEGLSGAGDPKVLFRRFLDRVLAIVRRLKKTPVVWQEGLEGPIVAKGVVETWKCWSNEHERASRVALSRNLRVVDASCWYLDWPSTWRDFANKKLLSRWGDMDGGEAAMWTEHVDHSNFECRVWPRTSVVAELLWRGRLRSPPPSKKKLVPFVRSSELGSFCPQLHQFESPRKPPKPPPALRVVVVEEFASFPDSRDTVVFVVTTASLNFQGRSHHKNHGATAFEAKASLAGYPYAAKLEDAAYVASVAPILVVGPGLLSTGGLTLDLRRGLLRVPGHHFPHNATRSGSGSGQEKGTTTFSWRATAGGEPPDVDFQFHFFERTDEYERGASFWRPGLPARLLAF
ncbi:hypothetical protein CTAYLR_005696 [Chrysophaeum taylorii]|uniref:beta-N-acetylhexosaminidase n=1 Tax=Chrysophaeum taylorii TaxID=2483200 RepID=A0AAD7UBF9_9STRA|nr:hypothetical protein CTAYLR_005696 [Chrysophaeum taylorii]